LSESASLPNTIAPEKITPSLAEKEKEYVQSALSDMSAETATQAKEHIRRLDALIAQSPARKRNFFFRKSEL
jgi:lipid A disaccharide synthetase